MEIKNWFWPRNEMLKKNTECEFTIIVEMTGSLVIKINYVDGIFLLDVHDWQGLPENSVKWEWLTPLPAHTNTAMMMTGNIY